MENPNKKHCNDSSTLMILKWAEEVASVIDNMSDDDDDDMNNEEKAKYFAALSWWGGDGDNNKNKKQLQSHHQQRQKRWSASLEQMNDNFYQSKTPKSKIIYSRKRLGDKTKLLMECVETVETSVHDISNTHKTNNNNDDNDNIDMKVDDVRTVQRNIDSLTTECKSTIRSYQEENDQLTKQYNKLETSYKNLLQQLNNDVPDPTILIQRLLSQKQPQTFNKKNRQVRRWTAPPPPPTSLTKKDDDMDAFTGTRSPMVDGLSIMLTKTKRKLRKGDGTFTSHSAQGSCRICKERTTLVCAGCVDDPDPIYICNTGRNCFPEHKRRCHDV